MHRRTTILLDDDSQRAARELAMIYDCSTSEAIRRAIIEQRNLRRGATPERRIERRQALAKLIGLFEGHDPSQEIARLKAEDDHA